MMKEVKPQEKDESVPILLILLFLVIINVVTFGGLFFFIRGITYGAEKFKLLRSNLKKTGMILEGTSFFGHPDKDTYINKNFAYVFLYGYLSWLLVGFVFTVSIILFDLSVTLGIIILMLQGR